MQLLNQKFKLMKFIDPKFKELEFVLVSGTATGYGDLTGWIVDINTSLLYKEPYYTVRVQSTHTNTVFVAETFIKSLSK